MFNFKKSNSGRIRIKLLALMLVLTLTFANFALVGSYVGEVLAAGEPIKFEAYFINADGEKINEASIDSEVYLKLSIDVKDGAYLENAKINIADANFRFAKALEQTEINLGSVESLQESIQIVARHEEAYDLRLLNMQNTIELTGDYCKDNKIEDGKTLKCEETMKWTTSSIKDEDIELTQKVITNKTYEIDEKDKRLVQLEVTAKLKDNKAPVKASMIEIENPIEGAELKSVKVVGYSTKATNGKTYLEFNDGYTSGYEYKDNKINIYGYNDKNDEGNVSWKKNCEDKYVVTFVYDEKDLPQSFDFNCNTTVMMMLYGRPEQDIIDLNENKLREISKSDKIGEIVTLDTNIIGDIYKGNMYQGKDTEYETEINLNVSHKDLINLVFALDGGDFVCAKPEDEEPTQGTYTYYKETKINIQDAAKVIGKNGRICIFNSNDIDSLIKNGDMDYSKAILDKRVKELENTGNDGYFTFKYNNEINGILLYIEPDADDASSAEGTIRIINKKLIKVTDVNKVNDVNNLNSYMYIMSGNNKNLDEKEIKKVTELKEPVTTFDFSIDLLGKSGIATESKENNLKITTKLIAADSSNKLFENPQIKIKLPDEFKNVETEDVNILNANGFQIVGSNIENNELVITLKGEQTEYNNELSNIIIEATLKNIEVNKFMADKNVEIKATCINNAENQESVEKTKNVRIVSKQGLITKNSIKIGEEVIEKINESNIIEVNTQKNTNATISSSIINNFGGNLSNINIEGNLPNGITLTGPITSSTEGVIISYSEDSETFEITLAELVKGGMIDLSYDVNVNTENTKLTNGLEVKYKINGQEKQQDISFNFNLEGSEPEEPEDPEQPEQPEIPEGHKARITIQPKTTTSSLYKGQIVTYEIKVKNTSTTETLNNVTLDYVVPEQAVLTELTYAQATTLLFKDDATTKNKIWEIEEIEPNETITKEFTLRIVDESKTMSTTAELRDEQNNVIANCLSEPISIGEGKISATLSRRYNEEIKLSKGDDIQYIVMVKNNTTEKLENVKITSKVPNKTKWVEDSDKNKDWKYDKNSGNLEYVINTLEPGETRDISFVVRVDNANNDYSIDNNAVITLETGEIYETNMFRSNVLMSKWEINVTSNPDTNIKLKEKDFVKYIVTVKNTGNTGIGVNIQDVLPQEIQFRKLTKYTNENDKITDEIYKEKIDILHSIKKGETLTLEIEGVIKDKISSEEISNTIKIDLGNGDEETKTITHKIEQPEEPQKPQEPEQPEEPQKPDQPEEPQKPQEPEQPTEKYSISGLAWFDENKNGVRDSKEKNIQAVKVMLLDTKGNKISEALTSLTGTYKFSDIIKGEYVVIFDYDETKYGVSKYQVKDATNENNSDVISKQVKLNNETITAGVTDTIKLEKDISNIDIGLIQNPIFDLSLNKYITKLVVTNSSGTSTYTYDDTQLAKVEISAKQLAGTVLLVEYEIEVSNDGDVEAYITDIVDYLPKQLEFNSEMNSDWYYLSSDRSLHYMELEPKAIEPGEKQTVKLVLTKTLKSDSTGTIENIAEIAECTNKEGLSELDSKVNNKKDGEDDISKASLIVSIKTGSPIMYIGIVLASMMVLGAGIYIIDKKVLRVRM